MGDVPRILNMYVLISFVVSLLSLVLVADLINFFLQRSLSAWD